jgi:hypothetical protein
MDIHSQQLQPLNMFRTALLQAATVVLSLELVKVPFTEALAAMWQSQAPLPTTTFM